jgi:hypothetical protein
MLWAGRKGSLMSEPKQDSADLEAEQLAALRAAIQTGVDDIEAGNYEDVDDTRAWAQEIAETVTAKSVA